MDDYDELMLAHDRYMAHEDLFTKWGNAAMLSQSILVAALTQILINRLELALVIGANNTKLVLVSLALGGLALSIIWLLTDWRNFYYTYVRIEVIRDLERTLVKRHQTSSAKLYGVLNKEFEAFRDLTSNKISATYKEHRKRWGRLFSALGTTVSVLFVRWFSTRYRFFLIPIVFALVWLCMLLLALGLPVTT
ncbi:MAG: hypothetical protein WBB69_16265 [Anaerolineales bacterium]